jgi:hypothetical protein
MNRTSKSGKMHWLFCFEVWLIGDPPECFGTEMLDHVPKVGDIITLHWSDGREAGKAKVLKVGMNDLRLEAVKLL